jgi:hypothetical protein
MDELSHGEKNQERGNGMPWQEMGGVQRHGHVVRLWRRGVAQWGSEREGEEEEED